MPVSSAVLSKQERNALIIQHRRLAYMVAHRMRHSTIESYDDLSQIALMGLIRATDKFDPSRGYAFSSFAVPFIRGEILHWVRDKGSTIKVPRRWKENYAAAQRHANPAEALGISESAWREQKAACEARTTAFPENWEPIATVLEPEDDAEPIMLNEYRLQLRDAMARLPEKYRAIVQYAYIDELPLGAWKKGVSAAEASEDLKEALEVLRKITTGELYFPIEEQLALF